MKSSEQIVESILACVANLYADPLEYASTVGELDSLLFQSHWLWADATDRMAEFVSARWNVFETDMPDWRETHLNPDFQNVVTDTQCFQTIIQGRNKGDANHYGRCRRHEKCLRPLNFTLSRMPE